MNLKIQSDRLDGSGAVQSSPTAPSRRLDQYGPSGRSEDSVGISDLSSKIAGNLSAADAQMEKRVNELAALYAQGKYEPNAAALSSSMVSRALDAHQDSKL
jgi:hypothetical protein